MGLMTVHEIFKFGDGSTLIVGELHSPTETSPVGTAVEVLLADQTVGRISICSDRMPGPSSPACQLRILTTDNFVWAPEDVRSRNYAIRWPDADLPRR